MSDAMTAFVFFWAILFGFSTLGVAQTKNRSAWWILVGVVLGPLGLHAALVVSELPPATPLGWVRETCPRCMMVQNVAVDTVGDDVCWQCSYVLYRADEAEVG